MLIVRSKLCSKDYSAGESQGNQRNVACRVVRLCERITFSGSFLISFVLNVYCLQPFYCGYDFSLLTTCVLPFSPLANLSF